MLVPFYRDSGIFIYLPTTLMRIARYLCSRMAQQTVDTISTVDENSRVKGKCLQLSPSLNRLPLLREKITQSSQRTTESTACGSQPGTGVANLPYHQLYSLLNVKPLLLSSF